MSSGIGLPDNDRLVATFVGLSDTLVDDFDLVDLLHVLTERTVELTHADEVGILVIDETGALHCMAASNERTHLLELFQVQNADGPCRDCVLSGEPVSVDDLSLAHDRWPLFAPRAASVGFRAVSAVPLRFHGRTLGALNLFAAQPGDVSRERLVVIQALADLATVAIVQHGDGNHVQAVSRQLHIALQSRVALEQAKGVIAEQAAVEVDEAFQQLRTYARRHDLSVGTVVRRIIDGDIDAQHLVP